MSETRFLVITGLSGSGKSLLHNCLEDIGYYCVDNLPIRLFGKFFELIVETSRDLKHAAVVTDVREKSFLTEFVRTYVELKSRFDVQLLFLEASEDVLIRRFSETRRPHPLAVHGSLPEALELERAQLAQVRELADHVIDTSNFHVHELREFIRGKFGLEPGFEPLVISVQSFGFKHGIPREADLVFDVRFLPNPYFHSELRGKTGIDPEVIDFVRGAVETEEFLGHLSRLLRYALPKYAKEGKSYLTICLGCTGGQHRSVVRADQLAASLRDLPYPIHVRHRDIDRP